MSDTRPCKGDAYSAFDCGPEERTCDTCQHAAPELVYDGFISPEHAIAAHFGDGYGKCMGRLGFAMARVAGVKLEGEG